jgi:glucose/arabinose dehydrogenase
VIVPLLLVLLMVVGLGIYVTMANDEPKVRADYCGSDELVYDLPAPDDAGVVASPSYPHLATVPGALAVAEAPDGRLFIAAKDGSLWQSPRAGGQPTRLLDLEAELAHMTEQGLLGVAVDPTGSFVYLDGTFADGTARLLEYPITPDGIDSAGRREVLSIEDPHPSHNGGQLAFDDSGALVFGIGDGGNGDVTGAAQDKGSLFGKLLRIDPRPRGDAAYGIPADNPFVGDAEARGEVLAMGFRNPWGWSIDPKTQDLWVGDVGQICREEIDLSANRGAGDNFGWPYLEGAHEFDGPTLGLDGEPQDGVDPVDLGERPPGLVPPVVEYYHGESACSVVGGVVYRGTSLPELDGVYLWADLCERAIRTLERDGDRWIAGTLGGEVPAAIVSFGQGADGEVYLVSLDDGVYRLGAAD